MRTGTSIFFKKMTGNFHPVIKMSCNKITLHSFPESLKGIYMTELD